MSDAIRLAPSPGETGTAVIHLRPTQLWPPLAGQGDPLADPSTDDLAPHLADLLPKGAAWRTPDGAAFDWSSKMGGLIKAFAEGLAALYRRIFRVTQESTASTLVDSMTDWEEEFGLPDACLGLDPSRETRYRALLAKVRSTGTITPIDFIDLAAFLGFTITIEEPNAWTCGGSECGLGDEQIAGGIRVDFTWIVKPGTTEIVEFECGVGRASETPLGEILRNERLECLFNKLKPAWTRVVFDYSGA